MILTASQKIELVNIFRTNIQIHQVPQEWKEEVKHLMIGVVVGTKQQYITKRRTGDVAMTRTDKLKVWEVFQNSLNQLCFEEGL